MSSLGAVGQTLPWPDDLAGGLSRTSPPLVTWRADWVGWPRRVMTWRAGWVRLALANGGQKALLSAKSAACLGEFLRPKTDRGGHTRTQPGCSGRLSAKTAKGIGGVPWTKADKMPDERTAGCNQGMFFLPLPWTRESPPIDLAILRYAGRAFVAWSLMAFPRWLSLAARALCE
jgi:hypothetical protein